MTAAAQRVRDGDTIQQVAGAAAVACEVHQMASGRAGYKQGQNASALNDSVTYKTDDQVTLPKAAVSLLDGGRAYWDRTNQVVTYKRTAARDFLLGSIVNDAAAGDANCTVNLNAFPVYDLDLLRDPRIITPVLSAGSPSFNVNSSGIFLLDATNEAQKIDVLGVDGFSTLSKSIIEARINVTADDSGTAATFSLGVGSGTHATAFTSITNSLGIQVKNHDLNIYAESKTASVTVAATDTTKDYAVGTPFEVWFDMRVPALCKVYINGIQVLTSTVFDVSASAVTWFLLAHLVKSSSTDTMQVRVDWARQRQMEQ